MARGRASCCDAAALRVFVPDLGCPPRRLRLSVCPSFYCAVSVGLTGRALGPCGLAEPYLTPSSGTPGSPKSYLLYPRKYIYATQGAGLIFPVRIHTRNPSPACYLSLPSCAPGWGSAGTAQFVSCSPQGPRIWGVFPRHSPLGPVQRRNSCPEPQRVNAPSWCRRLSPSCPSRSAPRCDPPQE